MRSQQTNTNKRRAKRAKNDVQSGTVSVGKGTVPTFLGILGVSVIMDNVQAFSGSGSILNLRRVAKDYSKCIENSQVVRLCLGRKLGGICTETLRLHESDDNDSDCLLSLLERWSGPVEWYVNWIEPAEWEKRQIKRKRERAAKRRPHRRLACLGRKNRHERKTHSWESRYEALMKMLENIKWLWTLSFRYSGVVGFPTSVLNELPKSLRVLHWRCSESEPLKSKLSSVVSFVFPLAQLPNLEELIIDDLRFNDRKPTSRRPQQSRMRLKKTPTEEEVSLHFSKLKEEGKVFQKLKKLQCSVNMSSMSCSVPAIHEGKRIDDFTSVLFANLPSCLKTLDFSIRRKGDPAGTVTIDAQQLARLRMLESMHITADTLLFTSTESLLTECRLPKIRTFLVRSVEYKPEDLREMLMPL
jgi:hypothetical protein